MQPYRTTIYNRPSLWWELRLWLARCLLATMLWVIPKDSRLHKVISHTVREHYDFLIGE